MFETVTFLGPVIIVNFNRIFVVSICWYYDIQNIYRPSSLHNIYNYTCKTFGQVIAMRFQKYCLPTKINRNFDPKNRMHSVHALPPLLIS